jgi:flavin reductase (DIM6/NTAB) family NADH-FMN oxidoreductase RutF
MSESGDVSRDAPPLVARGPDAQDFYKSLSGSVAKGVAVLSTMYRGRDYAATVTDFLSVSYDPPTMLASLYSLSRMAEALETAPRWALSLLADDQEWIAARLGETGAPLIGLMDNIPHFRRAPGAPALVKGALAWFELDTVASHPAATHTLVVGEVGWMSHPASVPAAPLVRFRSSY